MRRFPGYRNKGVESLLYHSHQCRGGVLSAGKKAGAGKGKFTSFFHLVSRDKASGQPSRLNPSPPLAVPFSISPSRVFCGLVLKDSDSEPEIRKKGRESDGNAGLSCMEPQQSRVEWCPVAGSCEE